MPESAWLGVTTPFHSGWPQFSLAAIVSMIVVMLITAVETTGDSRPFADPANLRAAFQEALFSAPAGEQRALMAAYPDLGGDRVADGEEGEESARDQAAAGLTRLADGDRTEFARLAAAYRERFCIPLIVCVRDAESRERILTQGRQRLENSPAQEHAAALIEIAKVANHRFADLVYSGEETGERRAVRRAAGG